MHLIHEEDVLKTIFEGGPQGLYLDLSTWAGPGRALVPGYPKILEVTYSKFNDSISKYF